MQDEAKPKDQLIIELRALREQIAELEKNKGAITDPAELSRSAGERLKAGQTERDHRQTNDTESLCHELEIRQIELEMQNEELRNALVQVEESRAKYSDLYDFAPIGYLTLDENGLVLEANLTIARQLGVERSRLVGSPLSAHIVPADRQAFRSHLHNALKNKTHQACEVRFMKGCGDDLHTLLGTIFIMDAVGERRLRTSATDITERKRAERSQGESEKRYKRLLQSVTDYIYTVQVQDNRSFGTVHGPGCAAVTGYSSEDYKADPYLWYRMVYEQDRDAVRDQAARVLSGEAASPLEHRIIHRDGSIRWVRNTPLRNYDEQGKLIAYDGMIANITERKMAEEALRESRVRLKIAMDLARLVQWEYDIKTGTFSFDDQFYALYGTTSQHEGGQKMTAEAYARKFIPLEESHVVAEEIARALATTDPNFTHQHEHRIIRADGEERNIIVRYGVVCDQTGRVVKMRGANQDITERKQAEDDLRVSLRFLEIVHGHRETAPLLREYVSEIKNYTGCDAVGIRVLDENLNIPYVAYQGFSQKFYESESLLSLKADECMCINVIRGDVDPGLPFYTEGGAFCVNATSRFLAKVSEEEKGRTRNRCNQEGYETVALFPFRSGGKIAGLVHVADHRENMLPPNVVKMLEKAALQLGTAFQRAWAENNLRESEARLRQIIDLVPHMIFVKDWDGKYLLVNKAVAERYNTSVGALMGKYQADVHPDSSGLQHMLQDDREVMATGKLKFILEEPCTGAQGSLRFFQTTKVPFLISGDKKPAVLGIAIDITDKRVTEEALRESEEHFRTLVQSAPDAIFIQVEGRFAYVNDAAIRLYGAASEKELLGRAVVERIHPDYRARVLERFRLIEEEWKPTSLIELKHLRLDGAYVCVESHAVPFRYRKSKGTLVFVHDITERKQTEESLLLSEERYSRLFEDASLGIFRVTPGGKLINVNPAYARMYGFDSPEEAKRQINDVAFDLYVDPSRRNEIVRMILDAEGPVRAENLYRRPKDGSVFVADVHLWAVRDREGNLLYLEGFVEDISERKRAEEERGKLETQLRQSQKLEAIGTLAGGIAHDFNNILQPMMGYTEMALSELSASSPMRDGLEQVLSASLRAKELIRQILTISRSAQEQQRIPTDISSIIKEALKLLRSSLPTSVEIRQNIERGVALADPTQIHQVLMNLCTNAAHAMDDKGILEVRLSHVNLSESDLTGQSIVDLKPGSCLRLTVSDTGCGMDASTMEHIFDPYFTTKEVGKGSGLGLAVVSGIVKRHEGAITVRSEPGKGTAFTIYIPRADARFETTMQVDDLLPRGSERILFVDDESAVTEMGTVLLKNLGYRVTSRTDSVKALEIFRSSPDEFDLIITDYAMPKMTGLDFAREVSLIRPGIAILLCTGFSEKITPDNIKELGIGLLMKPYDLRQISWMVRKMLDTQT